MALIGVKIIPLSLSVEEKFATVYFLLLLLAELCTLVLIAEEYVFTKACQKHQQAKFHGRRSIIILLLDAVVYAAMGNAGGECREVYPLGGIRFWVGWAQGGYSSA